MQRSNKFRLKPIGPVGSFVNFTAGELVIFLMNNIFLEEVGTTKDLGTLLETELRYANMRSYLCDK